MSNQEAEKAATPVSPPVPPDGHEDCRDEECQVCMRLTIPQHIDSHGTKIEDLAGTGEPETLGG